MNIDNPTAHMTDAEVRACLNHITSRMYLDLDDNGGEVWNVNKDWGSDILADICAILDDHDLVPAPEERGAE